MPARRCAFAAALLPRFGSKTGSCTWSTARSVTASRQARTTVASSASSTVCSRMWRPGNRQFDVTFVGLQCWAICGHAQLASGPSFIQRHTISAKIASTLKYARAVTLRCHLRARPQAQHQRRRVSSPDLTTLCPSRSLRQSIEKSNAPERLGLAISPRPGVTIVQATAGCRAHTDLTSLARDRR
jgi:hypothetical protein